jgi:glycosyltransferase involved in cell wall biosynthesis
MKQFSCKREQKWLIRSCRQINSPAGDCSSRARTNNSFLPLIGRMQLQLALAKRCRPFHAVEVAWQQSAGKNGVAKVGVKEGPLKAMNIPSPRSQVRGLELEQQRVEVEGGDRQYGQQHPAPPLRQVPYRFHANEQTSVALAMHSIQGGPAHGELCNEEGRDREYLIDTSCEWLWVQSAHILGMSRSVQRLLDHIKPDVIHLQHYSHFGIDVIPLLQTLSPASKIVVNLHEYLALCKHNGQMVTTGKLKLCHKATPLACSLCFPQHMPQEMFLRHHYISTILESCDALVSPGQFLIDRYQAFGIDHAHFVMIENGLPVTFDKSQWEGYFQSYSAELNRFGYFGKLNSYKDVLVRLQAVAQPKDQGVTNFIVNINGANLEHQRKDFQEEFNALYEKVKDRLIIRGSYPQQYIEWLFMENDWVVMPSIWWETDVVIQESFFYGRQILGSNIEGAHEIIETNGGGSFVISNPSGLSAPFAECFDNFDLHESFLSQMQAPVTAGKCAIIHIKLNSLLLLNN